MSPNADNKSTSAVAKVLIAVAVASLGVWLFVQPPVKFVRLTKHASGLVSQLDVQPKFRDVRAQAENTNGLALVVTGHVASAGDLAQLKAWIASTQPPVPVMWEVKVKPSLLAQSP